MFGVAPSGFGKDFPFKRTRQILAELGLGDLLGSSSPTSETSVLLELQNQKNLLFSINEAESVLKRMNDQRTNNSLKECLTDVFDMPGKRMVTKNLVNQNTQKRTIEKIGDIYSPCANVLMMCTDVGFSRYARGEAFSTGFFNRFLFFFEDRKKKQEWKENYNPPINNWVKITIDKLVDVYENSPAIFKIKNIAEKNQTIQIESSKEAEELLRRIFDKIQDEEIENYDISEFSGLKSRQWLYIHKIALIDHCVRNIDDYDQKPMGIESIEWAYKFVSTVYNNSMKHLNSLVGQSEEDSDCDAFLRYIVRKSKKGEKVSSQDLKDRFKKTIDYRQKIIRTLLREKRIYEFKSNDEILYYSSISPQ
jgi:hypothetical protein